MHEVYTSNTAESRALVVLYAPPKPNLEPYTLKCCFSECCYYLPIKGNSITGKLPNCVCALRLKVWFWGRNAQDFFRQPKVILPSLYLLLVEEK